MTYYVVLDFLDVVLEIYKFRNGFCIKIFFVFMIVLGYFDFLINKRGSGEKMSI